MTKSNNNSCQPKIVKCKKYKQQLNRIKCISSLLVSSVMSMLLLASTVPLLIDACTEDSRKRKMRDVASQRSPRGRSTWSKEKELHSDAMFFRLFRMKPESFEVLCEKIKMAVGPATFKSEEYLSWLGDGEVANTKRGVMYRNSRNFSGDYVSGEWKLAMTLRYLAGAKYLDLYLWSSIYPDHIKIIVNEVIQEWICNDKVFNINFYDNVLDNKANSNRIRREFSSKTEGILSGCIGAVDGWLVKILSPTTNEVPNPGSYFSRKNVYGLNVQVIVDKRKRILWRHIGEVGSSHDSQVFHDSRLGKCLQREREYLANQGLYIVGDSAYALRNYLLCPYDNALPRSPEDCYNYFLSSARIYVECCFGEVDRRWGILWGPIEGKLAGKKFIIDACLRLHNYVTEEREAKGGGIDPEEIEILDQVRDEFNADNQEDEHVTRTFIRWADVAGSTNTTNHLQEENEEELRHEGKLIRDRIKKDLWDKGFRRPTNSIQDAYVRDRHNRAITIAEEDEESN